MGKKYSCWIDSAKKKCGFIKWEKPFGAKEWRIEHYKKRENIDKFHPQFDALKQPRNKELSVLQTWKANKLISSEKEGDRELG